MKNKSVILLYLIPVFYMAMYCDITYRIIWSYFVAVLWLIILRFLRNKAGGLKFVFIGYALTLFSSALFIVIFQWTNLEKWGAYFGPFFPLPVIIAVFIIEIFIYEIKKLKK